MCNFYMMYYASAGPTYIICASNEAPNLERIMPSDSDIPLPPNPTLDEVASHMSGHQMHLNTPPHDGPVVEPSHPMKMVETTGYPKVLPMAPMWTTRHYGSNENQKDEGLVPAIADVKSQGNKDTQSKSSSNSLTESKHRPFVSVQKPEKFAIPSADRVNDVVGISELVEEGERGGDEWNSLVDREDGRDGDEIRRTGDSHSRRKYGEGEGKEGYSYQGKKQIWEKISTNVKEGQDTPLPLKGGQYGQDAPLRLKGGAYEQDAPLRLKGEAYGRDTVERQHRPNLHPFNNLGDYLNRATKKEGGAWNKAELSKSDDLSRGERERLEISGHRSSGYDGADREQIVEDTDVTQDIDVTHDTDVTRPRKNSELRLSEDSALRLSNHRAFGPSRLAPPYGRSLVGPSGAVQNAQSSPGALNNDTSTHRTTVSENSPQHLAVGGGGADLFSTVSPIPLLVLGGANGVTGNVRSKICVG